MSPPRWRPLPSTAGLDPRIRHVSDGACRAFFFLVCASDVDGVVRDVGSLSPGEVIAALADVEWVRGDELINELTHAGLVVVDVEGELVLPDVPRWQAEHAPRSAPLRPSPEASDDSPQEGAEVDRRTAGRRLSKQWAKRGLKDADSKARWLTSETGRSYLESAGIPLALATAIATGSATPDATPSATLTPPGGRGGATPDATPPATPRFPPVPLPREESRENNNSTARPRTATPATPKAPPGGTHERHPRPYVGADAGHGVSTSSGESSRFSSISQRGDAEILFDLSRDSEGHFAMSGSVDQQEAVAAVFRDSGLEMSALLDALKRPAAALAGFHMVTRNNFVSVAMLAGKRPSSDAPFPCDAAHSLVAFVRAQGAAPVDSGGIVLPTLEETEARVAREREIRRRIAEGPPRVMPQWRRTAPTTETETKEVAGG